METGDFYGGGGANDPKALKFVATYLASSSKINFFKPSAVVFRSNLASGNTLLSPYKDFGSYNSKF